MAGAPYCDDNLLNMRASVRGSLQVKITGFSEDDQTNLYNMAHDASGKGRQGLGIASRPKKVSALTLALGRPMCGLLACSLARPSSICPNHGLPALLRHKRA